MFAPILGVHVIFLFLLSACGAGSVETEPVEYECAAGYGRATDGNCYAFAEECAEGFGRATDGNCYPIETDTDADADVDTDTDADVDTDTDTDTDVDTDVDVDTGDGDTGQLDTGDTATDETGDTAADDTGHTGDTGETGTIDTADTGVLDPEVTVTFTGECDAADTLCVAAFPGWYGHHVYISGTADPLEITCPVWVSYSGAPASLSPSDGTVTLTFDYADSTYEGPLAGTCTFGDTTLAVHLCDTGSWGTGGSPMPCL